MGAVNFEICFLFCWFCLRHQASLGPEPAGAGLAVPAVPADVQTTVYSAAEIEAAATSGLSLLSAHCKRTKQNVNVFVKNGRVASD